MTYEPHGLQLCSWTHDIFNSTFRHDLLSKKNYKEGVNLHVKQNIKIILFLYT